MFADINKFTDKLIQYGITAEHFFVLYLIDTRDTINLKKYMDVFGKLNSQIIIDLIEKNYILNTNPKGKTFDLGSLVVTLEYAEEEVKSLTEDELFDQLLDVYPKHVIVNGTKYPTTGLSLSDMTLAKKAYIKEIGENKVLHYEVLSLIKEWKQKVGEVAPFKIDKFITSKYWNELRNEKDNGIKPRIY